MRKLLDFGLRLAFVSAAAAGMLAYVYQITGPKIAENIKREKEEKLEFVLPGAYKLETKIVNTKEFTLGYADQKLIGMALEVAPQGYGGPIYLLVGVSSKGRVLRLAILSDKETPGLGKKIHDYWFRQQFVGKKAEQIQLKKDSPQGTIEAISAATISSRAVTRGIRQAIEEAISTSVFIEPQREGMKGGQSRRRNNYVGTMEGFH